MEKLNPVEIPVEVAEPQTGLAQAVLTELVEHLQILAEQGQQHVIDLTSLPMNSTDKQVLENMLGRGEVSVTLSTLGDSEIYETRYHGIWWIKHYSADQQLISELIEITGIPEIIKSHPEDIQLSLNDIKRVIDNRAIDNDDLIDK